MTTEKLIIEQQRTLESLAQGPARWDYIERSDWHYTSAYAGDGAEDRHLGYASECAATLHRE